MLIKNYGLFWELEDSNFYQWNTKKSLKGWNRKYKYEDGVGGVDFSNQEGIYVLYDNNFSIIYIGQAGVGRSKLYNRLKQHTEDHLYNRWSKFSWFGLRDIDQRTESEMILKDSIEENNFKLNDVLNHLEAILISSAEPPLNKQSGRFGDAEQFFQIRDEDELGPDKEQMLHEIYAEIVQDEDGEKYKQHEKLISEMITDIYEKVVK